MAENGYRRSCIDCVTNSCGARDGAFPSFCLMDGFDLEDEPALLSELRKPDVHSFVEDAAQNASWSFGGGLSRIEETIGFARRAGYGKIGIAACTSMAREARMAARIFRAQGFEVFGAMCKIGSLSRPDLDIDEGNPDSVLCNPIYQAQLINAHGVDFNVIVGLCVGHDSLFMRYADAPCTVLVTKDYRFDHCAVRGLREGDESGLCERLLEEIQ